MFLESRLPVSKPGRPADEGLQEPGLPRQPRRTAAPVRPNTSTTLPAGTLPTGGHLAKCCPVWCGVDRSILAEHEETRERLKSNGVEDFVMVRRASSFAMLWRLQLALLLPPCRWALSRVCGPLRRCSVYQRAAAT